MSDWNVGDIVYWCEPRSDGRMIVEYGMVDGVFMDGLYVDYLAIREHRRVNGIPISEFESETKYKKLPKGWTYNTKLFEITWDELEKEYYDLSIKNPNDIKMAYANGFLVKKEKTYLGKIEADITKDGYRIIKKYPMWANIRTSVSLRYDKALHTYDEAQSKANEVYAEFLRQSCISDLEWSKEQIQKTIDRYANICGDALAAEKIRDELFSYDNVEYIETRIFGGEVQWKYENNKKWRCIGGI